MCRDRSKAEERRGKYASGSVGELVRSKAVYYETFPTEKSLIELVVCAHAWDAACCTRDEDLGWWGERARERESERETTGYEPLSPGVGALAVVLLCKVDTLGVRQLCGSDAQNVDLILYGIAHEVTPLGWAYAPTTSPTAAPSGGDLEYRGTSLIRTHPPLGPYSRPMPGATWGS